MIDYFLTWASLEANAVLLARIRSKYRNRDGMWTKFEVFALDLLDTRVETDLIYLKGDIIDVLDTSSQWVIGL